MTRNEQLEYCKKCKNRKHDFVGIICGLTDSIPQFEKSCKYFVEDFDLEKIKKERSKYDLDNWRFSGDEYERSRKAILKIDLFKINPQIIELVLEKRKFDQFSFLGLTALAFTFIYLITKDLDFLENLKNPINLSIWLFLAIYPLVRYYFPFKKYKLDRFGIELNPEVKVLWSEIKSIRTFEEIDDKGKSINNPKFYLKLKSGMILRLSFNNYTFMNANKLLKNQASNYHKLKERDIIELALMSFFTKYNTN